MTNTNPGVSEIIKAESLEAYVLNNFTGETLDAALAAHRDNHQLYSETACDGILQYHHEEIETLVSRDDAISAIHEGGKYDRDYLKVYQVHEALYAVKDMIRNDFDEIIEANMKKPLKEIVGTATPKHLQDPQKLVGLRGGIEGYISACFLGRDIYFAAKIARNSVTAPMAEELYKRHKTAIEKTLSRLPEETQTALANTPVARVNRAIRSLASEFYEESTKMILRNPTKTLPDVRAEILFGRKL